MIHTVDANPRRSIFSSLENSFDNYTFEVRGSKIVSEPTYLTDIMDALRNETGKTISPLTLHGTKSYVLPPFPL